MKTENEYLKNRRDTKDSLQSRKLPNKETVAAAHACLEIPVDTDPCRNGLVIFGYFAICVGGLVSGHARHPPDVVV